MIYQTKEEVLVRARDAIGIPFGKMLKNDADLDSDLNKGTVGNLIQERHFGYAVNSRSEADFVEAGVELKVTPYKKTKNGISSKERLVLNIIDYMKESKYEFNSSSFWKKNNSIQLMFYEHNLDIPRQFWSISHVYLWDMNNEPELFQITQDWLFIHKMITDGRAHEISEGMTLYLGACTKGANSNSLRTQPFSTELAKQRAFCIKSSFMTVLLNEVITGTRINLPRIYNVTDNNKPENSTFETYIISQLTPYIGQLQTQLLLNFGVDVTTKSVNSILLGKMLGIKGSINKTAEFMQAGIITKTIVVAYNGKIVEHMSFPNFNFVKLSNEQEWEESEIYNYFSATKFLFVIFQHNKNNDLIFKGIKFWSMPTDDLLEYQNVWQEAVTATKQGNELLFPRAVDSRIGHVRPHAKDKLDVDVFPNGLTATKRCFWLNNKYISQQITDIL
jgi:DNA mismatch repair endonuclease MutH